MNTDQAFILPPVICNNRIKWDTKSPLITVAANRTLGSILQRMNDRRAQWVIVLRSRLHDSVVYYYAFRNYELEKFSIENPERKLMTIECAMDMHEWKSSNRARNGRLLDESLPIYFQGPATGRIINFNTKGHITAIGERIGFSDSFSGSIAGDDSDSEGDPTDQNVIDFSKEHSIDLIEELPEMHLPDLGPVRSGCIVRGRLKQEEGSAEPIGLKNNIPLATDKDMEITLSSETKAEIQVGENELVDFRIELSSAAVPLAVSQTAKAKQEVPIVVSLSVETDSIEVIRNREYTVQPPTSNQPRTGFFLIKGTKVGMSRLSVTFRQGGSELGIIGLMVEVVGAAAGTEKIHGSVSAAPRDITDDSKLTLYIEQRVEGNEVYYQYILHSEGLSVPYSKLLSKPLLDRGNGKAATTQAFVERIYAKVTKELKSFNELKQLQRETRALGVDLCQELFDPDVAKVLWPLRDRLKLIQIVSWEPYIPWELVRLRNPDTDEIDDRFLAEYGLVRTLSDVMAPRELPLKQWSYLGANFPHLSFKPVGAELEYFTSTSAKSLQAHGIKPAVIIPTRDAFYDALAQGDFDVLHISCHAESKHDSIEEARLILGDEVLQGSNQASLIEVDTITVKGEAKLKNHRPLVFLNACETGRAGAELTSWGGWPNVFLRAGAGAFVGTAWAVRDKPAAVFATEFYNSLLSGKVLSEAARSARVAAKMLGDASWLAFKVYGHPNARRL